MTVLHWLLHTAWRHLWPALIGAGAGQVVVYLKLKARLEVHHIAQLAHARQQGEARDAAETAAAEAQTAQAQRLDALAEAVGELADATRAVLAARDGRHGRNTSSTGDPGGHPATNGGTP